MRRAHSFSWLALAAFSACFTQVSLIAVTVLAQPPLAPYYLALFPHGSGAMLSETVERRFVFLRYFLYALCGIWLVSLNGDGDSGLLHAQQVLTAARSPLSALEHPLARHAPVEVHAELRSVAPSHHTAELPFAPPSGRRRLQLHCVAVRFDAASPEPLVVRRECLCRSLCVLHPTPSPCVRVSLFFGKRCRSALLALVLSFVLLSAVTCFAAPHFRRDSILGWFDSFFFRCHYLRFRTLHIL